MADPLRIGIVGCGRILNAHLNGYQALRDAGVDDFEVTAICARDERDALRFVAPGGPPPRPPAGPDPGDPLNAPHRYLSDLFPGVDVRVFTHAERMIDEAELDIVDITAAVGAHEPVALHAARRGRHVMVQKPMATSLAGARAMVEAADAAGTALAVLEDQHWQPTVMMAAWAVAAGHLGDPQMAVVTHLANGQWSPDGIVAGTPWRHRAAEAGAGIAYDLGVHFFAQLRRICGDIDAVYGHVRTFEPTRFTRAADGAVLDRVEPDVDDAMFCQVAFANGAVGQLSASWAGHGPPTSVPGGTVVYGSRGCLRGDTLYLDGRREMTLEDLVREAATDADREALFPRGIRNPFARAYLDLFDAIRDEGPPAYDGRQGLLDLAWSTAVIASSERQVPCTATGVMKDALGAPNAVREEPAS